MAKTRYRFKCDTCGHHFTHDKISLAEDNEFDLDLCDSCLEDQREVDAQEETEVDLDFVGDVREEIREMQELERRDY